MFKFHCWMIFILISVSSVAEPYGYNPEYKYERVKVVSCEASEKIMLKKAEFRNYSSSNKLELLESSKSIIILEVIPLFEVELITSVYNGSRKQYLGKVTPITKQSKIKLHMINARCENYTNDKEIIVSISSNYNCGRELVPKNHQETSAACLVEYERAVETRIGEYR